MFVVVYFAIYCHTTEAAELYLLPHQELKKVAHTLPYVLLFSFHFTFDKTKGRKPLLPVEVTARAFFLCFINQYDSLTFVFTTKCDIDDMKFILLKRITVKLEIEPIPKSFGVQL